MVTQKEVIELVGDLDRYFSKLTSVYKGWTTRYTNLGEKEKANRYIKLRRIVKKQRDIVFQPILRQTEKFEELSETEQKKRYDEQYHKIRRELNKVTSLAEKKYSQQKKWIWRLHSFQKKIEVPISVPIPDLKVLERLAIEEKNESALANLEELKKLIAENQLEEAQDLYEQIKELLEGEKEFVFEVEVRDEYFQ